MPQLDHVTYFSQSFWLTVFFLSFYVVLVKALLPKVSTTLKLRRKLAEPRVSNTQKDLFAHTATVHDKVLMGSLLESKSIIANTSEATQKWSIETMQSIQNSNLPNSQEQYVDTVGQLLAKKYVLQSLLSEAK